MVFASLLALFRRSCSLLEILTDHLDFEPLPDSLDSDSLPAPFVKFAVSD